MNNDEPPVPPAPQPGRRRLLGLAGAAFAAPVLAAPAKPAKPKAKTSAKGHHAAPAKGKPAGTHAAPAIVQREPAYGPRLTAQTTEGPYYFDPGLLRNDITEGRSGVPLEVRFVVVDQAGVPFANAQVDIWHCDAQGVYSGYVGQGDDHGLSTRGQTFLRGRQRTDRHGVASFRTIYPGWYEGRTTHIHFKVWNGDNAVLTSQFFLPDALSEYVYGQADDYRRPRLRDTLNSTDGIALQAGNSVLGSVREEREQYVASLAIAVDRSARPMVDRPPVPGDGAPPPGPPPERTASLSSSERTRALLPGPRR